MINQLLILNYHSKIIKKYIKLNLNSNPNYNTILNYNIISNTKNITTITINKKQIKNHKVQPLIISITMSIKKYRNNLISTKIILKLISKTTILATYTI